MSNTEFILSILAYLVCMGITYGVLSKADDMKLLKRDARDAMPGLVILWPIFVVGSIVISIVIGTKKLTMLILTKIFNSILKEET